MRSKALGWLEASILAEEQAPSFCGTDSGVLQETKGGQQLNTMS